ncbi:hypothetical protein GALL_378520 [mine drainage metagenome]|uniref:DUF3800 domain-containing protein n=1 Tax=mine drainage metagenome TaxID=410659 RepID=A0A1J5QB27_9ZZZZ
MKFEVYCDEANPDVLTSANPRARHLMIGSLWLPEELRNEIKSRVGALLERRQAWGEIKWSKVSPNRRDFYVELIDLFFAYGDNLRFRCIAVDRTQLNLALHDNDGELGFYKFYYQLLHHWILDFNAHRIFCDVKSNRDPKRLSSRQFVHSASIGSRRRTLEHPTAALFEGWDKTSRQYDATRRLAVVYEDFVVVVAMGLKQDGSLKANFVTCYQADNSIAKIRSSPVWSRAACLRLLAGSP